ncbi:hypothetical protein P9112_010977 [Eukaryota sp. TZLM1-RC]
MSDEEPIMFEEPIPLPSVDLISPSFRECLSFSTNAILSPSSPDFKSWRDSGIPAGFNFSIPTAFASTDLDLPLLSPKPPSCSHCGTWLCSFASVDGSSWTCPVCNETNTTDDDVTIPPSKPYVDYLMSSLPLSQAQADPLHFVFVLCASQKTNVLSFFETLKELINPEIEYLFKFGLIFNHELPSFYCKNTFLAAPDQSFFQSFSDLLPVIHDLLETFEDDDITDSPNFELIAQNFDNNFISFALFTNNAIKSIQSYKKVDANYMLSIFSNNCNRDDLDFDPDPRVSVFNLESASVSVSVFYSKSQSLLFSSILAPKVTLMAVRSTPVLKKSSKVLGSLAHSPDIEISERHSRLVYPLSTFSREFSLIFDLDERLLTVDDVVIQVSCRFPTVIRDDGHLHVASVLRVCSRRLPVLNDLSELLKEFISPISGLILFGKGLINQKLNQTSMMT